MPRRPRTEEPAPIDDATLSAVMSQLGRRGGAKGGHARAAQMTQKERTESARKAARARWKNTSK